MFAKPMAVAVFGWGNRAGVVFLWGLESGRPRETSPRRNTAHAPVWFAGKLAAHEQGGGGQLRADTPGACVWLINMPALPYIKLLVVTLRQAWFNFRGCNKRL